MPRRFPCRRVLHRRCFTGCDHHPWGDVLFGPLRFGCAFEHHALAVFSTLSATGRGFFASNQWCVERVGLHQVEKNREMRRSFRWGKTNQLLVELVAPILVHVACDSRLAKANEATAVLGGAAWIPKRRGARRPAASGTLPRLTSFDCQRADKQLC